MPVKEEKSALRRQYLAARKALDPVQKKQWDEQIARLLCHHVRYRNAETLLAYVSLPHEVNTAEILQLLWQDGRCVALPRCAKDGQMDFYLVRSPADLSDGRWSISEPNDSCPLYLPNAEDLCLVPGLAFDQRGFRLGHGGGYYDRYLARFSVPTIGLCYPGFRPDVLPTEPFDVRIEEILCATFLQGGEENA